MIQWLEKTVMPCPPPRAPRYGISHRDHAGAARRAAVLHPARHHDSLASAAEARLFADRLRSVFAESGRLCRAAGAQHTWDVFRSVRAMESVQAVMRFSSGPVPTTERGR